MTIISKEFRELFCGGSVKKSIKQGIVGGVALTLLPVAGMIAMFGPTAVEMFSQPSKEIRLAQEEPTRSLNAMRWTCNELGGTNETAGGNFSCRVETAERENSIKYSAGGACKEGLGGTLKITRGGFTCEMPGGVN